MAKNASITQEYILSHIFEYIKYNISKYNITVKFLLKSAK